MAGMVLISWRDHACHIALRRPAAGNALSAELVEGLHDALDQAEAGKAGLVVFSGEGKHFCTGFDLSNVEEQSDDQLVHRFIRIEMLLARVFEAPFITIACAQGRVLGAGADLFTACSLRYADPHAQFGFPGAGFGIVLGTRRLAARIGAEAAQDLVVTGKLVAAAEAERLKLATRIVEERDLEALVEGDVIRSSRLDNLALASVRQALGYPFRDSDLADLVRSAVRPGLGERIARYRANIRSMRSSQSTAASAIRDGATA